MFYGAWRHSLLMLTAGLLGVATSWFWFPKPARIHHWVQRFIDVEREYVSPPWNAAKVIGLVAVLAFVTVVTVALWRHDARLGLSVFILGALAKSVWSLAVAKWAGIPAAVIGILSAAVAAGLLWWLT
jgi:hypothetical protein